MTPLPTSLRSFIFLMIIRFAAIEVSLAQSINNVFIV